MPAVEDVRVILERTFGMPVAESDAQIVLDRLNELASKESRPTRRAADWLRRLPHLFTLPKKVVVDDEVPF